MKQAAFKAFAALGANEEDIRKQVMFIWLIKFPSLLD
jgi:hypothetical protein